MPRFDKYDPISGGFRAPLDTSVNLVAGDVGKVIGVGLNASGRVVRGAGATGVLGVICPVKLHAAGDPIDVQTDGEVVDCTGLAAGTVYYANTGTGALETAAPAAGANKTRIGWTVEATRLVVRAAQVQG